MRRVKIMLLTLLLGALVGMGIAWSLYGKLTNAKEVCGHVESITIVRDGFNGEERPHVGLRIDGQERITDLVISWTDYHNTVVQEHNCFVVEAWQLTER